MERELILEDREKKYALINSYTDNYTVVTLKANVPGINKNINEAFVMLKVINKKIMEYNPIKVITASGADGLLYLYLFKKGYCFKDEAIKIENDSFGRLIDIDVYESKRSLSRGFMRKCLICDDSAFNCMRLSKHNTIELISAFKKIFLKNIDNIIYNYINEAMFAELNLDPKFGLVTKYSVGSHSDMNYEIMVKGKNSIIKYFIEMFNTAFNSNESYEKVFIKVREIGVKAEEEMLCVNGGINTYKGLIFDLGLIVSALGIKLSRDINLNIKDIIKFMTKGICDELSMVNTYGGLAYRLDNIKGARGEAENGFEIVFECAGKFSLDSDESLYNALAYLIYNSSDTCLYKRSGSYENYIKAKDMFKDFVYSDEVVNKITKQSVDLNLSYGGSADLLICSVFIKYICEVFDFKEI